MFFPVENIARLVLGGISLRKFWCFDLNIVKRYCFCREADITKERIEKMLKAGANVILTTKGIDDMALKVCTLITHACSGKVVICVC